MAEPIELFLCRDCGVSEGELHVVNCCVERCTKCGGQRISCNCNTPARKRAPFFSLVWHCCTRCGAPWPKLFMVPDDVWRPYILSLGWGDMLLCEACFGLIVQLTDGGAYIANRRALRRAQRASRASRDHATNAVGQLPLIADPEGGLSS
jgi:hypothetical protein